MHKVIQGVKENDLHQCVKDIVAARVRRREDEKPVVLDPNHFLSTYRQMLFLTLVALGQDNIDLTAFDREYRRAFEKLSPKLLSMMHPFDYPPDKKSLFCRKLFRDLR